MKIPSSLLLAALLIAVLVLGCGPSPAAQRDETATQVAMSIFATQTAEAPTITATFTPALTPTSTPTAASTETPTMVPTLTPEPTSTSRPTRTPTFVPTPRPALTAYVLTPADLPAGFVAERLDELEYLVEDLAEGSTAFAMADAGRSQFVWGLLMPYPTRAKQLSFDATLPQYVQIIALQSGGKDVQKLEGLEDIGEARAAVTSVGDYDGIPYRTDIIGFRRGEVAVLLVIEYPEGDAPVAPAGDLARVLEARVKEYPRLRTANLYQR